MNTPDLSDEEVMCMVNFDNKHKGNKMNDVNTENTATPEVAAPAVKPAEVKFVQNEKEVGDAGAPKAADVAK